MPAASRVTRPTALSKSFFARDTVRVARELIGTRLVRRLDGEWLVARVVETEAYREDEPACHAHRNFLRRARGEAPRGRSALLFDEPGTAYVYFNYGMHWLFNVVTEPEGVGCAVLIRAVEPLAGIERMRALRAATRERDLARLASGPGKLTQALAIGPEFNGHALCASRELFFARPTRRVPDDSIASGPRVGIRVARELPWRFWLRGSASVSAAR